MEFPHISAVIIVTEDQEGLKEFYEDIFGFSFGKESHGELKTHYFAIFGSNRLVIHAPGVYEHTNTQQGAIHFAVAVDSLEKVIEKLNKRNCEILKDSEENFGRRIEFNDPDGNFVQGVELKK